MSFEQRQFQDLGETLKWETYALFIREEVGLSKEYSRACSLKTFGWMRGVKINGSLPGRTLGQGLWVQATRMCSKQGTGEDLNLNNEVNRSSKIFTLSLTD